LWLISPAKINLFLQVLRKREDNYHEIYSLFQKISLYDEIELRRGKTEFSLSFSCEEEIPLEKNLLFKTWRLFKEAFSVGEEISLRVKKRIPLGAGLGGGSSNAGTLLKALGQLFGIPKDKLYPLAIKLGADVPFFLEDYRAALARGIGEHLEEAPSFEAYYLLIYPGFKIETAWAYQNLNLTKAREPVYYEATLPPWESPQGLINDFKVLIYRHYPIYHELERHLYDLGAIAVNLSGTGSTIYGVFGEPPVEAYARLKKLIKGGKIFLAKNLT